MSDCMAVKKIGISYSPDHHTLPKVALPKVKS